MDRNIWYIYFYTNFLNSYNKLWGKGEDVGEWEDPVKQRRAEGTSSSSFAELLPVSLTYPTYGHTIFSSSSQF